MKNRILALLVSFHAFTALAVDVKEGNLVCVPDVAIPAVGSFIGVYIDGNEACICSDASEGGCRLSSKYSICLPGQIVLQGRGVCEMVSDHTKSCNSNTCRLAAFNRTAIPCSSTGDGGRITKVGSAACAVTSHENDACTVEVSYTFGRAQVQSRPIRGKCRPPSLNPQ